MSSRNLILAIVGTCTACEFPIHWAWRVSCGAQANTVKVRFMNFIELFIYYLFFIILLVFADVSFYYIFIWFLCFRSIWVSKCQRSDGWMMQMNEENIIKHHRVALVRSQFTCVSAWILIPRSRRATPNDQIRCEQLEKKNMNFIIHYFVSEETSIAKSRIHTTKYWQ